MNINHNIVAFSLIAVFIAVFFFGLTNDNKERSATETKKNNFFILKIGETAWRLSQPKGAFSGTTNFVHKQKQYKTKKTVTKKIVIDNKKKGSLYFKPPKEMKEYETETVPIALSRSGQDLTLLPVDFFDNLTPPERRELDVSGLMAVDLTGNPDEFNSELMGNTPKIQKLSDENIGIWRWAVTPLKPGTNRVLTLTVYSVIPDGGSDRYEYKETYRENIVVKVNYPGRISHFFNE